MIATTQKPQERLKRFLSEYKPQLEKALDAIKILDSSAPDSEEFTDALANLQVCATILEPYSEGIVEAINEFTEDMYSDEL